MQTETLQAMVVARNEGGYVLKRGSFIHRGESDTTLGILRELASQGVIKWGKNLDEHTREVLEDINVPTKTKLGWMLFGRKQFYTATQISSGQRGVLLNINYMDDSGNKVDPKNFPNSKRGRQLPVWEQQPVEVGIKEESSMTPNHKIKRGSKLLADILPVNPNGVVLKAELTELIHLWVGRTELGHAVCTYLIRKASISNNTLDARRGKLYKEGYITTEGIDLGDKNIYNNWKLVLTKKGVRRYEELVHKCIKEDKREEYLSINKPQFEDDLKPESLYDFYTRMRTKESTRWGDTLALDPQQNVQQVLGVATYYQTMVVDSSIKGDCDRIAKESVNPYLLSVLKMNLELTLSMCYQFIQQGKDSNEHKKNVVTLTQMLGVYEELVICTM